MTSCQLELPKGLIVGLLMSLITVVPAAADASKLPPSLNNRAQERYDYIVQSMRHSEKLEFLKSPANRHLKSILAKTTNGEGPHFPWRLDAQLREILASSRLLFFWPQLFARLDEMVEPGRLSSLKGLDRLLDYLLVETNSPMGMLFQLGVGAALKQLKINFQMEKKIPFTGHRADFLTEDGVIVEAARLGGRGNKTVDQELRESLVQMVDVDNASRNKTKRFDLVFHENGPLEVIMKNIDDFAHEHPTFPIRALKLVDSRDDIPTLIEVFNHAHGIERPFNGYRDRSIDEEPTVEDSMDGLGKWKRLEEANVNSRKERRRQ